MNNVNCDCDLTTKGLSEHIIINVTYVTYLWLYAVELCVKLIVYSVDSKKYNMIVNSRKNN